MTAPRSVVIHHRWEFGTWLTGTTYGDAAWSVLHGTWEWEPATEGGAWRQYSSVGQPPDLPALSFTRKRLIDIGFQVQMDIPLEEVTGTSDID